MEQTSQQKQYAEQIVKQAKDNASRQSYTWADLSEHDRSVFIEEARTQLPTLSEMVERGWITQ